MLNNVLKATVTLGLIAAMSPVFAEDAAPATKAYMLTKLQKVDSSDATCKKLYTDLSALTKKPIVLQYANQGNASEFDVKHGDQQLINHSYKIIAQTTSGDSVNRTGMGSFELNNTKMNYVLQITADLSKPDFKYNYPMIILNEKSHCVYTAVLVPDAKTVATFKKHIKNGNLENGADLTAN